MSKSTLQAESRTLLGRSASRCLRSSDKLPAVIYGGNKEPKSITLSHNEVFHALENEAFFSSIIDLSVDGKIEKVVLKDLQRHAYKPKYVHLDFLRVNDKTEIHVHVPLHFEGVCPAVKGGGVVNHLVNEVEVACLPKDLPEFITVDLSKLELDHTLHLSDLQLPKGIKLVALNHGNDAGVVNVHIPRALKADDETDAPAAGDVPAAKVAADPKGDNAKAG